MKLFSRFLIWCLGHKGYLRIPQRLRRALGMACGEDMTSINKLLKQLKEANRCGRN